MKKIFTLFVALVMALSLVACSKSATTDPKTEEQPKAPVIDLYTKTEKNGSVVVVDKDGKVVDGYTVDDKGNVLDKDGKIAVAADQVTAYVEPAKAEDKNTKAEDKAKTENKTADKAEQTKTEKNEPAKVSENTGSNSSTNSSSGTQTSKPSSSGSSSTSSSSGNTSKPSEPAKPSQPSKPAHTHSYSSKTVAPTCKEDGYTVHTCSCGDSYKDNCKDALGHDWKAQYKNVTVDDYETKCITRCVTCGKELSGQEIIDHSYYHLERGESDQQRETYEKVKVGSHTEKELTGYTCTRCGASK